MLDFSAIIKPAYWFDLTPAPLATLTESIVFVVFALLIVSGVAFRIWGRQKKVDRFLSRLFHDLARLVITMGCLGFVLLFFSFEQIRLLGARFWYLFWGLGFLIWLGLILYKYFKVAPRERLQEELRHQREKYLPKKKK